MSVVTMIGVSFVLHQGCCLGLYFSHDPGGFWPLPRDGCAPLRLRGWAGATAVPVATIVEGLDVGESRSLSDERAHSAAAAEDHHEQDQPTDCGTATKFSGSGTGSRH